MDHPEGARETGDGRLGFDRRVRLEFRGTQLSSDGGLLVTCLMSEGVMRGEVLGVERRRRWSDEEKLSIVSSVGIDGATVTQVAHSVRCDPAADLQMAS